MRAKPNEEAGAQLEAGDGGLAELIELERRLEAELAEARRQADARVESARQEALHILEAPDAEEARADLAALRADVEREYETGRRELEERAERDAARFERAEPEEIERLGRWVAARLGGRSEP